MGNYWSKKRNPNYVKLLEEAKRRLWDGNKRNPSMEEPKALFICEAVWRAGQHLTLNEAAVNLASVIQTRLVHKYTRYASLDSWARAVTGKTDAELYPRSAVDRQLHRQQWLDKLIEEFGNG